MYLLSVSMCIQSYFPLTFRLIFLLYYTGTSSEFKELVIALDSKVINLEGGATPDLTSNDLGRIFYGIQNISNLKNMQILLEKINTWITPTTTTTTTTTPSATSSNKVYDKKLTLTSHDVGLVLYGFKGQIQKERSALINSLLHNIAHLIDTTSITTSTTSTTANMYNKTTNTYSSNEYSLNPQTVSMAFLGLQGFSDSVEIEAILTALTPRICSIDHQATANMLYSMRHMSTNSGAVLSILARVAPLIEGLKQPFTAQVRPGRV